MAANSHSTSQAVELEMIRSDLKFYRQLTEEVAAKKSGILSLGLIPYMSLFVIETYCYFSSHVPGFAKAARRQHEGIIRASRTRTKLFDDTRKDIALLIADLEWVLRFFRGWMTSGHAGLLAPLKKRLQPDMGFYFYGEHLISTTQAAFFSLGFEKDDIGTTQQGQPMGLSQLMHSVAYDLGEYLGFLTAAFERSSGGSSATLCRYQLADSEFRDEDRKSHVYLRRIFNGGATPQINACLLLFLTTTNFLIYILARLVVDTPDTWFKIKFLTLYHVISSLTKLQDHFYTTGQLSERSKDYLRRLLRNREVRVLRSKSSFRNILVHYTREGIPEECLKPHARYFGLIEHFFDGSGFKEVNDMIDGQLLRIANALEAWKSQAACSRPLS